MWKNFERVCTIKNYVCIRVRACVYARARVCLFLCVCVWGREGGIGKEKENEKEKTSVCTVRAYVRAFVPMNVRVRVCARAARVVCKCACAHACESGVIINTRTSRAKAKMIKRKKCISQENKNNGIKMKNEKIESASEWRANLWLNFICKIISCHIEKKYTVFRRKKKCVTRWVFFLCVKNVNTYKTHDEINVSNLFIINNIH